MRKMETIPFYARIVFLESNIFGEVNIFNGKMLTKYNILENNFFNSKQYDIEGGKKTWPSYT